MKRNNVTNSLIAALVIASPIASAGVVKYPAADFEPKVVYADSDYKHAESAPTSSSTKAKKLVPKVAAETSKADSRYPAANFEPTVVFEDSKYKHKDLAVKAVTTTGAMTVNAIEKIEAEAESEADDSMTSILGLLALAVVGFMLFGKKSKGKGKSKQKAIPTGPSGVAKYLANKEKTAVSSVTRYLEGRSQTRTSGVAKYIARQVVSARQDAVENVSGVEKYMRNKG